MPRKKRALTTFSLSFLDIMSCGLGAAALIFLIMKHGSEKIKTETNNPEKKWLVEDIRQASQMQKDLADKLSSSSLEQQRIQAIKVTLLEQASQQRKALSEQQANSPQQEIIALKKSLEQLKQKKSVIEAEIEKKGSNVRQHLGDGERQYLTGLNLGGQRILILLDASTSMLDATLVNIIRKRNMDERTQRRSEKWQKALSIINWLISQIDKQSQLQLVAFNEAVNPVLKSTDFSWIDVSDSKKINDLFTQLDQQRPTGGTNLAAAFQAISQFNPPPDNVFLITDGLPTLGLKKSNKTKVTQSDRVKLFNQATEQIRFATPFNIILLPMEGDPMASAAFWQLAQNTKGSFITPSKDWP